MENKITELQANELKETAHNIWLLKFGLGCKHTEKSISVRHSSGLSVYRCKKCGVQIS